MTGISTTARETALTYHRAWTSGDLDGAIAHVADDIVCRAPGGDITGKDAYRGFLGGFATRNRLDGYRGLRRRRARGAVLLPAHGSNQYSTRRRTLHYS